VSVEAFVRERRGRWKRLESLLDLAEGSPLWELGTERLQELVRLYRQAASDLNEARSYTANPDLLGRLNDLVGRGYRFVYRRRHGERWRAAARRLFAEEIPRAFRAERASLRLAAAALVLGAALGLAAVVVDPGNGERLIPAQFFTESPRERVERIESSDERIESVGDAAAFGASLYTHNIQVSFLAFALGALTLVGGLALLFYNGVILGAVAGMYWLDGVQGFFFAWVGPHGALEIPAIAFGAAAGLRLGQALWLPGVKTERAALREALPAVARMLAATMAVLVLAGLIEGLFSQFTGRPSHALKTGVAVVPSRSRGGLFGRRGRRRERARTILTPEHVEVRLEPAGLGAVVACSWTPSPRRPGRRDPPVPGPAAPGSGAGALRDRELRDGQLHVLEVYRQGRTPGKQLLGLRVVDGRGLPLSLEQSLVRNVVRALDFALLFYGLGALACQYDSRRRRLGDIAADTLVIR
jgi:uncharacterized membrane protein SpoIIM required for sporulation